MTSRAPILTCENTVRGFVRFKALDRVAELGLGRCFRILAVFQKPGMTKNVSVAQQCHEGQSWDIGRSGRRLPLINACTMGRLDRADLTDRAEDAAASIPIAQMGSIGSLTRAMVGGATLIISTPDLPAPIGAGTNPLKGSIFVACVPMFKTGIVGLIAVLECSLTLRRTGATPQPR